MSGMDLQRDLHRDVVASITSVGSECAEEAKSELHFSATTTNSLESISLISVATLTPPGSMSGRDVASSPVLGGKIGYYFPQALWLGLELEGYYTIPRIEQQSTRVSVIPGSILNGVGPVLVEMQ
jgi:hypothetical protein